MNKDILNQLTFGFEIEGLFKLGMADILGKAGNFVSDSSVFVKKSFDKYELIPNGGCNKCIPGMYCQEHHARFGNEGSVATEYSSAVYNDFDETLQMLRLFDSQTHTWNQSCGLHFHIGHPQYQKLWSIVSDYDFLKSLFDESLTYCKCQNKRLENGDGNHYARFWSTQLNLITAAHEENRSSKLRFIRFHPIYKTLECRFLSPCEHKAENVTKVIDRITDQLGSIRNHRLFFASANDTASQQKIAHEKNITPFSTEVYKIVKKLHQPDPYILSDNYKKSEERNWVDYAINILKNDQLGEFTEIYFYNQTAEYFIYNSVLLYRSQAREVLKNCGFYELDLDIGSASQLRTIARQLQNRYYLDHALVNSFNYANSVTYMTTGDSQ